MTTPSRANAVGDGGATEWRWITASEATEFATDVLLSPTRTRPVVAVTTNARTGELTLGADRLASALAGHADVVAFETGEPTRALSDALPGRLDVYGGAARIWWPGLSAESDPYAHPLIMFRRNEADAIGDYIVATVRGDERSEGLVAPASTAVHAPSVATDPAALAVSSGRQAGPILPGMLTKSGRPVVAATVTEIARGRVHLRVGEQHGVLAYADEKLGDLAARLVVGEVLPAFVTAEHPDGTLRFSTQGLIPRPDREVAHALSTEPLVAIPRASVRPSNERVPGHVDPWRRLDEEYRVGDVVRGRVSRIKDRYVLVELLPGAALLCHIGELDHGFVHHPGDVVALGERVNVEILSLDPEVRRGEVSIRQAGMSAPRPAIAPGPDQSRFLADENGEAQHPSDDALVAKRRAQELLEELDGALADRAELMKRLKAANEQVVELRKELRSSEDRFRALESRGVGDLDPSSSETAFLTAVRVEYARRFNESDRTIYPLQPMRVGRDFLTRLRELDGISVEKVVEVCAQVASLRAHEVAAREVHELWGGEGGAPARFRDRDNARAWRCALQINTASARRLHWWDIPGKDGRIIEFASVAVHDDYTIP